MGKFTIFKEIIMSKVKYLYVLGSVSQVTFKFVEMLNKRYSADEHLIYIPLGKVVLTVEPEFANIKNVIFAEDICKLKKVYSEYQLYKQADNIILHGMFFGIRPLIPFFIDKNLMKKVSWIEHGGDLYNWKNNGNGLRAILDNYINKKIKESAKVIGICHPLDEKFLRAEFEINAPVIYTQFRTINNPFKKFEENRSILKKEDVFIQVGHNAFQFGNHIKILNRLVKFKDNDIKIILPMSYGLSGIHGGREGGVHYRNAVFKLAKLLFNKKAILMSKKIPFENYLKYLWNVDIVVLGLERQAALGNIHPLLYMNKKIFLPGDSPMFQFFVEQGVEIYDTNKISNMSFEEFIRPNKKNNKEWIVRFLTKYSYETWDRFFKELDKI